MAGLGARLAAAGAAKKEAKGKSKTPDVKLVCDQEIRQYAEHLRVVKDAEAKLEDLGKLIWDEAEEALISMSRTLGQVQTSLRLNGTLTMIAKNGQYCQIPLMGKDGSEAEQVQELRKVFGEKFDSYFSEANEVSVKAEALSDTLIASLSEACEKAGTTFGEVFSVKSVIKPTEKFTTERFMSEDTRKVFNAVRDRGIVKPYKVTLKE